MESRRRIRPSKTKPVMIQDSLEGKRAGAHAGFARTDKRRCFEKEKSLRMALDGDEQSNRERYGKKRRINTVVCRMAKRQTEMDGERGWMGVEGHTAAGTDWQSAGASHLNAAAHLRSVAFDGFLGSTEDIKKKASPKQQQQQKNTKVNVCVFDRPCCGCRVRKIILFTCTVGERSSLFSSPIRDFRIFLLSEWKVRSRRRWWVGWGSFATAISPQACHLKTDTRP